MPEQRPHIEIPLHKHNPKASSEQENTKDDKQGGVDVIYSWGKKEDDKETDDSITFKM